MGTLYLAVERHLAGVFVGLAWTMAAAGSCCTTWRRRFYAPVTVSAVPCTDGIELRAVNDTPDVVVLDLTPTAVRAMDGTTRPLGTGDRSRSDPDAAVLALTIPARRWQGRTRCWPTSGTARAGAHGGDVFAPKPWKTYDLLPPSLTMRWSGRGDGWKITVDRRGAGPVRRGRGRPARALLDERLHAVPGLSGDSHLHPRGPRGRRAQLHPARSAFRDLWAALKGHDHVQLSTLFLAQLPAAWPTR